MPDSIQAAWEKAAAGCHGLAPELSELVPAVCREIDRRPANLPALRTVLDALLAFLASPAGRTDVNCRTVDLFFCVPEEFGWAGQWNYLPEPFQAILGDLGGALHDTISSPRIAETCESLPEQLLGRVRAIKIEGEAI